MNNLWQQVNYKAPIQYLIDIPLREFDISKANISVLRDANILSEDQYQYYLHCPKIERAVAIGKMQGRDPHITEVLKAGIANARKVFMEINALEANDILSIRNDAITVIGDRVIRTDITERVKFNLAGAYRSYYKIGFIEYFYNYDLIHRIEILDIKGLGDQSIELHKNYMLDFLKELFYSAQIEGVESAIKLLTFVHSRYKELDLESGFYRELNPPSRYKLNKSFSSISSLYIDEVSEWDKKYLDIGFNDQVLREFGRILSAVYFKRR